MKILTMLLTLLLSNCGDLSTKAKKITHPPTAEAISGFNFSDEVEIAV